MIKMKTQTNSPQQNNGKRLSLFLERAHWVTEAWVDDQPLGTRDSLCVPHVYDMGTALAPGRHLLTVRVDNRLKYDLGTHPHSVSEETQTDWNGLNLVQKNTYGEFL